MRRRCRRIGWSSEASLQKTTATTGSEPERGVQAALQRGVGDAEPHHHPPPQRQQLQSQPCLRQRRQPGARVRVLDHGGRSEERSVGKEGVRTCCSGWSPSHYKKKTQNIIDNHIRVSDKLLL